MRELLDTYDAWRAAGVEVGRAVVIRTFGSSPRAEGAVLLVASDGRMIGSVSGGCVESAVAAEVLHAQQAGRSRVIRYGISDEQAWGVGLACGGIIEVLVQPAVPDAVLDAARTTRADAPEGAAVLLPLPVEGGSSIVGARVAGGEESQAVAAATQEALAAGRSAVVEVAEGAAFVEVFPPRPRLVVVGATEVSRHLVAFARALGYGTTVVDARSAYATAERFPDVDALIVDWPEPAFEAASVGSGDAVAVLSHDPKLDEPAILDAFRRGVRYVGAIGSRKTQAERARRLADAGLAPEDLARLHAPIGLDLGGREPAETALAVMAEIVADRYRRSGSPLQERPPAGSGTPVGPGTTTRTRRGAPATR
jgi:xanthine dehydrogenase accessory factor